MDSGQAFAVLQRAGGIRAARIVTDSGIKLNKINVWRMAYALQRGVPVAKIIHQKWFWGLKFYTNRFTLDPRPDTETLVQAVLDDTEKSITATVLDIGTGTACIIAAIAYNRPNITGIGIDKSFMARRVAHKNIKLLGLEKQIKIIAGDFYKKNQKPEIKNQKFDIIVSNPPYIAHGDWRVDIGARHDPKMALYAADNGYAAYRAIAKNSKQWIHNGGKIYLEIGVGMAQKTKQIFINEGWNFVRANKDLAQITRVLIFEYQPKPSSQH